MNELEIKGSILELISSVKDKETLRELEQIIQSFVGERTEQADFWEELSHIEKNELSEAIKESEDEENHIGHDDVMKKYSKWLKK